MADRGSQYLSIIDGKHYTLVKSEPGNKCVNLAARCLLCPGGNIIHGDSRTDANFKKHLKRLHPDENKEYEDSKKMKPSKDQGTLRRYVTGGTLGRQRDLDMRVMTYIVIGMKPLSTVEEAPFRELILTGENKELKMMSRSTLSSRLQEYYDEAFTSITMKLKKARYICLTADAWSKHGRGFLGVTAHWINDSIGRESALVGFSRFTGTHSYDRIASALTELMAKYEIKDKVVSITTDNGSNFVKAFKVFGTEYASLLELEEEEEAQFNDPTSGDEEDDSSVIDVGQLLETGTELELPPHIRCASHCLNLIGSKDILKVQDKAMFHKATGKCVKLWNLSSSPKCAEKVIDLAKKNFKRPVPTRWNSFYDALGRTLDMKQKLPQICEALGVPELSQREVQFLEGYHQIAGPVANGLDLLQGEKQMYMGVLLPTVTKMKEVLRGYKSTMPSYSKYLDAYIAAIDARFQNVLEINVHRPSPFLLGAVSHPFYKLRWLPVQYHESMKRALIEECRKCRISEDTAQGIEIPTPPPSSSNPLLDFPELDSMESGQEHAPNSIDLEMELLKFLGDPDKSMECLVKYPHVKQVFLKYNTALPSSAPVERAFSYAGLILSSRRCSLSDNTFETLVYLKCNSVFKREIK